MAPCGVKQEVPCDAKHEVAHEASCDVKQEVAHEVEREREVPCGVKQEMPCDVKQEVAHEVPCDVKQEVAHVNPPEREVLTPSFAVLASTLVESLEEPHAREVQVLILRALMEVRLMETKVAFLLRDNSVLEQALDRSRACRMEAVHQNIKLQFAMQKEEDWMRTMCWRRG